MFSFSYRQLRRIHPGHRHSANRFCVLGAAVAGGLVLAGGRTVQGQDVSAGSDMFLTSAAHTSLDFGDEIEQKPLPAGIFSFGGYESLAFTGVIQLEGVPLGGTETNAADTIVERLATAHVDFADPVGCPSGCPCETTVPVQIQALSLQSTKPIEVSFLDVPLPTEYEVTACLSSVSLQVPGTMTIRHECAEGGTFDSTLPVTVKLAFTKVNPLDVGIPFVELDDPAYDNILTATFQASGFWSYEDPGGAFGVIPSDGGTVDGDCDGAAETPFPATSNFITGISWTPCTCSPGTAAVVAQEGKEMTEHQERTWAEHGVAPNKFDNGCVITCKDGSSSTETVPSAEDCHSECDDFCGNNDLVESCIFKGENLKGNCDVECKDGWVEHIVLVPPDATDQVCRDNCHSSCDTHGGVQTCMFKGANVKGQCEGVCKDGTLFHGWALDAAACQAGCNDACDDGQGGVFACYFKDENVKGNCDVFCKDLTSAHITLDDPTDAACHAECDGFCGGNENVLACFLKGENLKGGLCSAECKVGPPGVGVAQNKGACHDLCDVLCGGDKANVLACHFKEQSVKGNCVVECKDELLDDIMLPSTNPPLGNTPDACQQWCKDTCVGHGGTATCDLKGEPTIPAVTPLGMVVMVILVLAAGAVVIKRARAVRVQG